MRLIDVFKITIKILKGYSEDNPGKKFTNKAGESIFVEDVIHTLENLIKWMYPDTCSEDVRLVVHCNKCSHYKKYKKKADTLKPQLFMACDLDMSRRSPDFYCGEGVPK